MRSWLVLVALLVGGCDVAREALRDPPPPAGCHLITDVVGVRDILVCERRLADGRLCVVAGTLDGVALTCDWSRP